MTPLDIFNAAKQEYWSLHGGPQRDQPGGNSYECDEFVARRVFAAGADSKLESYEEEIANLCVDKASLEGRLASTTESLSQKESSWIVRDRAELENRLRKAQTERDEALVRVHELEQKQQKPAEDRRCGTCKCAHTPWNYEPCASCDCRFINWQKR